MNTSKAHSGLTKLQIALAAMATACLMLAFSAAGAKAASGDPFHAEFQYAGLTITAAGEEVDQIVLDPESTDKDDNLLGALSFNGTYTDDAGNFTLPKSNGLDFPKLSVPVGPVTVDGEITLDADATGNYNNATGQLDLNAKISLKLGVDDIAALGAELGFPLPGSGALECTIAPLDVALSTENGWPHAAGRFADAADLKNGSVSGAWRYKPEVVSGDPGKQYLCDLIGGLLEPVGGLWLANSDAVITNMPAKTTDKPDQLACEVGTVGDYPDCVAELAVLGSLKIAKTAKVKAGKSVKLKVSATNTGNVAKTFKIAVKSSNKQAKVAKTITLEIAADSSASKTVVVKTGKKAKGKAVITVSAEGKSAKSTVKIQAVKKKKKKKKK